VTMSIEILHSRQLGRWPGKRPIIQLSQVAVPGICEYEYGCRCQERLCKYKGRLEWNARPKAVPKSWHTKLSRKMWRGHPQPSRIAINYACFTAKTIRKIDLPITSDHHDSSTIVKITSVAVNVRLCTSAEKITGVPDDLLE
jgi:hypothetical protein